MEKRAIGKVNGFPEKVQGRCQGRKCPGFWMKDEQDLVWGASGYEKCSI